MSVFEKGLVTVLACACLVALVAAPLALRRIPRNPVYGFRTCATLGDDALWYAANAHFGRGALLASLLSVIAIVVLYRSGLPAEYFLPASVATLVVPLLVAALATSRHLRALAPDARGPGRRR